MTAVLVVTLGTSPDPIINCINSLRPDRVVFICSVDTQPRVDEVVSKVAHLDFIPDRDVVVLQQRLANQASDEAINELDQLDKVYLRCLDLFSCIRRQQPGSQIIADYTGGTKTMTTGLAMAAIDDSDVQLNLTVSNRTPNKSTISGYSAPVLVSTAEIHARRLWDLELPKLLSRFDYEAARQAVRRVMAFADVHQQTGRWLKNLDDLLVALDAWDRFDHKRALDVLEGLKNGSITSSLLLPLKRVIGSRRILDLEAQQQAWPHMRGHGFEAVEDLLWNAQRRVAQDRYDDAVGRLYRAMELNEQLLLKVGVCDKVGSDGILTSDVNLDLLPDSIQGRWREALGRRASGESIKIGLSEAYDLLADLGHPTGLRWKECRSRLVQSLNVRNNSLFAHGFRPVDAGQWRALWGALGHFLIEALEAQHTNQVNASAPLVQLPSTLKQFMALTQIPGHTTPTSGIAAEQTSNN